MIVNIYGKRRRYTEKEIADMKQNILSHIENEKDPRNTSDGPKTAWRLHLALDWYSCGNANKKKRARAERMFDLYTSLTTSDDLPNWQ